MFLLASLLYALKIYLACAYMTFPQWPQEALVFSYTHWSPCPILIPPQHIVQQVSPNPLTLRSTHPPLGFISADFLLETHLHRDIHLPSTSVPRGSLTHFLSHVFMTLKSICIFLLSNILSLIYKGVP